MKLNNPEITLKEQNGKEFYVMHKFNGSIAPLYTAVTGVLASYAEDSQSPPQPSD